jgi:hypothetical protein
MLPGETGPQDNAPRFEALQVARVDRGGYEVLRADWQQFKQGDYMPRPLILFACTTLQEALDFVRDNIEPNAKLEKQMGPVSESAKLAAGYMRQRNPALDIITDVKRGRPRRPPIKGSRKAK